MGAGRGSVSVSGDKDVSSLPPHSSSHAGYALSGSELPKPSYSIWLTKSYVLRFISFCLLGFLFFPVGLFYFFPPTTHTCIFAVSLVLLRLTFGHETILARRLTPATHYLP